MKRITFFLIFNLILIGIFSLFSLPLLAHADNLQVLSIDCYELNG